MSSAKNLTKFLNLKNMNPQVITAEYAVRGKMAITAAKIREELANGTGSYPFDEVLDLNIGNPHVLGQKPISFYRQTLSVMANPELINSSSIPDGVKKRAQFYLDNVRGGIGSYSDSSGYKFARENIARFLERRDGVKSSIDNIELTDGASSGIESTLQAILTGPKDGIMIPIPQYPLYTALIALFGAQEVTYDLNEEEGWQVSPEALQKGFDEAKSRGVNPRAIVIINPGNPTGQVLSQDTIEKIVEFAYKNKVVIMADEVYQENIYKDDKKFVSFKKVVANMPAPYNQAELFSYHSTSKGILGECGYRGGYFEMFNIDHDVNKQIHKLKTIKLCSNTNGQLMTDLMVNPPTEEENGRDVTEQFHSERDAIFGSLKRKAKIVHQSLNSMKGVTCNEVEGAMYAFPRIHLPQRAIDEAKSHDRHPDLFYCLEVLKNTGICTVQGSGFRQKPDQYHYRTTILIDEKKLEQKMDLLKQFNDKFMDKYAGK